MSEEEKKRVYNLAMKEKYWSDEAYRERRRRISREYQRAHREPLSLEKRLVRGARQRRRYREDAVFREYHKRLSREYYWKKKEAV